MVNRIRVAGVTMDTAPAVPRIRVAGITMTGSAAVLPRLRVAGIQMTGTQSVAIQITAPADLSRLNPLDLVTVTAAPIPGGATPTSYTFTSTDVTFSGSGATRTFRMPGGYSEDDITFSVYGTLSGVNSPTITRTYTALVQLNYTLTVDGWTPALRGRI